MGLEVTRVLRDGFYDVDREIVKHVKDNYSLDHIGSGIEAGIRVLLFSMPKLARDETAGEWVTNFDDDLVKRFPNEKFT